MLFKYKGSGLQGVCAFEADVRMVSFVGFISARSPYSAHSIHNDVQYMYMYIVHAQCLGSMVRRLYGAFDVRSLALVLGVVKTPPLLYIYKYALFLFFSSNPAAPASISVSIRVSISSVVMVSAQK